MAANTLLEVRDLSTNFTVETGVVNAVEGVELELTEGETLGIVGESGSGKSVTALSIMQLIDDPGEVATGEVLFKGEDLTEKPENALLDIRGDEISMVFQDPMTSLNPVFTVGQQMTRVILKHQDVSKTQARDRAVDLLDRVGIPEAEERIDSYPHEFSGGMRQRVLIAMAISCDPDVLIADEPTTALDVTIESQIFSLLEDLQAEFGMSLLLITHDLGVVADACDRMAVMYSGRIVERGDVETVFTDPKHPYTRGMMRAIPRLGTDSDRLSPIDGSLPNPENKPRGCYFHPRCPHATDVCREHRPELREVTPNRQSACLYADGYGPINEASVGGEPDE
jgi:peptide/nickel transport system ATP-binding protein